MHADPGTLQVLLSVQELDRRLDRLAHEHANVPELELIADVDRQIAALDVEVADAEARRHEIAREQKRHEDEVATIDARIAAENDKLYGGTVTAIKELQALQEEIAGLETRKGLVEDHILEVMERAEPVDDELTTLARRREELVAQRGRHETVVAERRSEIDAEVAEVTARRTATIADVADDLVAEYERLRAQPGQVAIARLVGMTCHGCHLDLAAVEVDRLKKLPATDLVHCDECGCILVR